MIRRPLKHLPKQALLRALAALVSQDCVTTSDLLAHMAEVEVRRLYLEMGYSSMYAFCIGELHMSEDIAIKRLRAARAALRFPTILDAVADGRLHVSGVSLLARHLTEANADELLASAMRKTKAEIELLLAQRFPQPDVLTEVRPVTAAANVVAPSSLLSAPEPANISPAPGPVTFLTPQGDAGALPPTRVAPLAPGRFALQVTVDQETHDLLRYAQALLGHAVPSGDMATVFKRALNALVEGLERQKFAKCARSRPRRGAPKGRYIPAEVRRTVFQRDEGRCTFVGDAGRRCDARSRLEFDHADPVAKGGQSTTNNLRLRCRAHNQFEAERAFGAGFMHEKRERARAHAKARAKVAPEPALDTEVIPWLRQLGFSAQEAKRGAALSAQVHDAPLEQRVRVALSGLAPGCARTPAPMSAMAAA